MSLSVNRLPFIKPQEEEFNSKPKEDPYNPIEKDSNVNHLPKSRINSEKINGIYEATPREIDWQLKKEKPYLYKPKYPVENTKRVISPVPPTVNPCVFHKVNVIKGSYNKSNNQNEKQNYFEGKQYLNKPSASANYPKLIQLNHTPSDLKEDWNLLQEMKGEKIEHDARLYEKSLKICMKEGKLKDCEAILQEMKQIDIKPNRKIRNTMRKLYNVRIGDCIDDEKLVKSASLLKRMESAGIRLDIVSCNMMLHCYLKYGTQGVGDLQAKVKIVQEYMQRLLLHMEKEGIQPDKETHAILRQFNLEIGDQESDSKDVESKKSARELLSFNLQISRFAGNGDFKKCYRILNKIKQSGLVPDVYSCNRMIYALVIKGRHKEAWDLLNEMRCMGVKPDVVTYNTLMEVYKDLEDREGLRALLLEMKQALVKPNVVTYTIMMGSFSRKRNLKEAWNLLKEMKEEKIEPDATLCKKFLKICMEQRNLKYCEAILQEMKQIGIEPNIKTCDTMRKLYNVRIRNCVNNKELVESVNLFKGMESIGIRLDIVSYNMMLLSYLKYGTHGTHGDGDLQAKVKTVQEYVQRLLLHMEKEGIQPDKETYEILMQFNLQIGNQEAAKTIFVEMLNADIHPNEKIYEILEQLQVKGL